MAKFIESIVNSVHISYEGVYRNNPVNIDLCTSVELKEYADGYGGHYPMIVFKGCDTKWKYKEGDFKHRSIDYANILERNKA